MSGQNESMSRTAPTVESLSAVLEAVDAPLANPGRTRL